VRNAEFDGTVATQMGTAQTEDGARLHYDIHGDGPDVLLVHGTGIARQAWSPQVAGLRDRFRVIAFDNRGIGQSTLGSGPLTVERMAADALAVLDDAGIARAHVVGHSLGGLVAIALALHDPERVRSLALLCTFADGGPVAAPRPWIVWVGLRARLGTPRMRRHAFLEMIRRLRRARSPDRRNVRPRPRRPARDRDGAAACTISLQPHVALGRAGQCTDACRFWR
jgi:pimeloyl-ACP methyl ester carboxylesterase